MKWFWLLCLATLVVAYDEELELAEPCDQEACQLPDCRCASTQIPGGLDPRDTPQFVTVTFDDGVNIVNIETYRETLYDRKNSNGCPAGATFYVSHEYTNYQLVNELYNRGFEIALHSITHQTPQTLWQEADPEFLRQEILDQKRQMSHFANIPTGQIHGVRLPFLQLAGNNSFLIMQEAGLTYDCTWVTISHVSPGLWPYTLDYASTQDCIGGPCPSATFPGIWVQPMVAWQDLQGLPCAMADSCFHTNIPALNDEEGWFRFILSNFERHYMGNRAPFGFYVHEWYLASNPAIKRAFVRFLNIVNELPDAFMVNSNEVIDWIKNPVPMNEYREQPCRWFSPTPCPATSCGPLQSTHTEVSYWMQICNACPRVYPWLGNPLGA